jgi:hypothetical protein
MVGRALCVGSQTGDLTGADQDAERAAGTFEALGFAVDRVIGPAATREGILDAYRRLARDARPGDAAVFYYAGHGTLARNQAYAAARAAGRLAPRHFQFLVPVDFAATTDRDFRGIASHELSVLLGALTDRTRNATVILDCCHAAAMVRVPRLRPRALPHPITVGVEPFLERLRAEGVTLDRLDVEGNPHAVRLVAAGVSQSAYERTDEAGASGGLLTEALLPALREAFTKGEGPGTWRDLLRKIRARIAELTDEQRPEAEGPARRLLFRTEERTAESIPPPPLPAPPEVEISWGVVEGGRARPLGRSGETVTAGQRIYVRVENRGEATVHASVFDVGVTGRVSLLTVSEPSGVEIRGGEEYVLGYRDGRGLVGLALGWPEGAPGGVARPESLVVFVSDTPEDLRGLEARPDRLGDREPAARIDFTLEPPA